MNEENAIESLVDRLINENRIGVYADPMCRTCKGRGILAGDRVEYWGYPISLPETICECSIDRAHLQIQNMLHTGELQLRYDWDGNPIIDGAAEAGLIDDPIV